MNDFQINCNIQTRSGVQNLEQVSDEHVQVQDKGTNESNTNLHGQHRTAKELTENEKKEQELQLKKILEEWHQSLNVETGNISKPISINVREKFINNMMEFHKGQIDSFPDITSNCLRLPDIFKFEKINKIKKLNINYFRSEFYPSIGHLPLEYFAAKQSNLTEFPEFIKEITTLNCLILSWNSISIVPEWIDRLKNITTLNLANNYISSLPNSIINLSNLIELYIEKNELENLPDIIGDFEKLKVLNVSKNKLLNLPTTIGRLKSLEEFDCRGNQLGSLPIEIGDFEKLKVLDVSKNKLSNLPTTIGRLKSLEKLICRGNQLKILPIEIGGLTKLYILDIRSNCLLGLPETIGNLTELRALFFVRETVLAPYTFADDVDLPMSILNLAFANLCNIGQFPSFTNFDLDPNPNSEQKKKIIIPYHDKFCHLICERMSSDNKINLYENYSMNASGVNRTLNVVGISNENVLKEKLANPKFESLENLTLESNHLKIRIVDGIEQLFVPSWLANFKNLRVLTFASVWSTKYNE